MKILNYLPKLIAFWLSIHAMPLFSQDALVTVQNEDSKDHAIINVKWYSQRFVYNQGVNLYRTEVGTQGWVKLNESPIKQWTEMPKNELDRDSSLRLFSEIMKQIRPDQINGMVLLHLMAESFASPIFCKFIGIQYDDPNVEVNKKYQYKVMSLDNEKEELLAMSEEITAGPFSPKKSPKDFFAKQVRKTVCMGWEPEDSRFYAVNVYRKNKAGKEIMLNHKPVTISMFQDTMGNFKYPLYKFIDDSVKPGNTYEYRIAGIDFFWK